MTLRPEILDDGSGGKIVGWQDRDLANAELAKWEALRPAPVRAVATRVASTPPALPPRRVAPAVVVAPAAQVEENEDEWEWTIAIARARAAAEEVEEARVAAPPAPAPRRTRQDTVPPPPSRESERFLEAKTDPSPAPKFVPAKTQPMAVVATQRDALNPIDTAEWPKTEPLGNIDYDDYTSPMNEVVRVVRIAQAARPPKPIPAKHPTPATPMPAVRAMPRASSPATIIPVPKLPRLEANRTLEPVVAAPRRFPKGTGPQTSSAVAAPKVTQTMGVVPPPPIRPDDRTSPGIRMPAVPSIKRAASRG
ncbi:MAG: hypothetical protein ABI867_18720 [Kofleriaceae bacterium]